ncbi:hypothetical protein H4Q26_013861 [Puccinia striiformis f. sp. tritici PST-130]|nr:hypothetical protein H4Q26_013861 [Puccinia striiformis f. sp. tritici PST-130]
MDPEKVGQPLARTPISTKFTSTGKAHRTPHEARLLRLNRFVRPVRSQMYFQASPIQLKGRVVATGLDRPVRELRGPRGRDADFLTSQLPTPRFLTKSGLSSAHLARASTFVMLLLFLCRSTSPLRTIRNGDLLDSMLASLSNGTALAEDTGLGNLDP